MTFRVAEEEKLEDVTGKRSREKGSKVTPKGESVAGRAEGRLRMRADKECCGVQRGVGVLGVRRSDAPPLRPHARGAFKRARAILASPSQRKAGVEKLRSEVYAATSRRTGGSRIKTLRRLSAEARIDLVPVTNAGMELLAAALKAGTYRSAAAYLAIWKQMQTKAGHPWTADLEETRIECGRSLGRGIGPAKRAAVVRLEALPDRWEQADRARIDVAVVGAMWLLRAAIFIEQAEVAQDEKSAFLWLGLTQTNLSGKESQRILWCACRSGDDMFIGTRVCPVFALQRTLRRQEAVGFTSKHPIVAATACHSHQSRPGRSSQKGWVRRSPSEGSGRRIGGEGVVGTLGSCARLGQIRHVGGQVHPGRSWHVSPRLVGWIKQSGLTRRKRTV